MHERWTERPRAAHDRRSFLRLAGGSALGASTGVLAGCGGDDEKQGQVRTGPDGHRGDVALLNSMFAAEQLAIAAYEQGLELLSSPRRSLGRRLLEHEREHAARLTRAIGARGGTPDRPPPGAYEGQLGDLRDEQGFLRFAADLARTAVSAYLDALPKLSEGDLRSMAAEIASSEAEHLSVLLGALGAEQVGAAFAGEQDT